MSGAGEGRPGGPVAGLRDLMKATFGFSWAMSLFGVKSLGGALQPDKTAASLDTVTHATEEQLGEGLRGVFRTGDRLGRTMVDMVFGAMPGATAPGGGSAGGGAEGPAGGGGAPGSSPGSTPTAPPDRGRLDTSTFVALGEGLAAGMADFFLSEDLQRECFPAQMARQMQADFPQALLEAPGIGHVPGFQPLPVQIPGLMQTTVVQPWPPPAVVANLSIPEMRVSDARELRPRPPLVHRDDSRQTACNLIVGARELVDAAPGELRSPLEAALAQKPTLVVLELGYLEAIEAAVHGDPDRLPEPGRFRSDYRQILGPLRKEGCEVLMMNVPDPGDTAGLSTVEEAARVVKIEPRLLLNLWGLQEDDRITPRGLVEIGFQFLSRGVGPLPDGCVVSAEAAGRIARRVREINEALEELARETGAPLCDLHGLFREIRERGLAAGSRRLTAGYLGGFYSLNGFYPGRTGHAAIANHALEVLDRTYGSRFPRIDLGRAVADDPVALYQPAEGPDFRADQMPPAPPSPPASAPASAPEAAGGGTREVEEKAAEARRATGTWPEARPAPGSRRRLELPPGLEQVLPLVKDRSYFGDALRAVDCRTPAEAQWGSCGGVLFGGLAMVDSHLTGQARIRFSPPQNDVTHFEVTLGDGLTGDDGILAAPQLYKLPAQQNRVQDIPGMVSSGDLDLRTGEVNPDTLKLNFSFLNTALLALIRVNPNFPQVPISFPGQYGSAWARFEQRPDGKLDFEISGTTFLPLGNDLGGQPVRFPLPFSGPSLQFASIPTRGLSLHPHFHLSTREEPVETPEDLPEIPTNTVREYTLFTHNTSFGDAFTLTGPFLGGPGMGRSQLVGRLHVQFGERAGNTVPIYVSAMNPGGLLAPMAPSPISQDFPGRLTPGPGGFNEFLRFPLRSFYLDDVYLLSDTFDLPVGAVDVRTGRVIGEQLHRGFIGQDVFFALLRVEPRTPKSSFFFRGPAVFQKTPSGQTVYRYLGEVHIPYPEGFLFPEPNLAMGFPAGPSSSLDPFFWMQAMDGDPAPSGAAKKGSGKSVLASNGERFSYRFEIPADPSRQAPVFEYTNQSQQGSFRLESLASVFFGNARTTRARAGEYDTVTFAGFGTWSKNGVDSRQPVAVQISTASGAAYVGIQIGGGAVSNVNTKPPDQEQVLP